VRLSLNVVNGYPGNGTGYSGEGGGRPVSAGLPSSVAATSASNARAVWPVLTGEGTHMKILVKLGAVTVALAGLLSGGSASASTAKPAPLPVLYNYNVTTGGWTSPQIRQKTAWLIFVDGSAFIYKMKWSRWNGSTAVASAVYYDRTGPCCTKADQHFYKITMTLSDVWRHGGPHPGPYFDRMTLTGGVHAKLTYNQKFKIWNAVYYKK
jgi:hypothetical protein